VRTFQQEDKSRAMDLNLTKRQSEIFEFIKGHLEKTGYPPTVREIGNSLGLHSPSTVHAHLSKLESAGVLRRDPSKPRAIEILVERTKRVMRPAIPLVGEVAAGTPILAEENVEDHLEIPAVIGAEDGDFALRVKGDSMQDAGILGGDFVVVHPTPTADDGEIVVAMLEDEATVKRFYREDGAVRLQPENDAYEPIISEDVEVLGKVIGVFRRL
jgi:repressor LexA